MSSLLNSIMSGDHTAVNQHMDDFFNERLQEVMNMQGEDMFTLQDLDKPVNDDETLREYLQDGEKEFGVHIDWDGLTDDMLNAYVKEIDALWDMACS